jgi:hypothetical protein
MPRPNEPSQELSFEEIGDRYFGEWIVVKITETGQHGRILRGQVMGHSRSYKRVRKAWEHAWQQDPQALLYVSVAGEKYLAGDEAREAIAKVAREEDYVNARW